MVKPLLYERAISSCSFRIRLALNIAGIEYVHVSVTKTEGESPEYRMKNPQGLVPLLVVGEDSFSQSMSIFEYLVELYPDSSLLPEDPIARARIRSIAQYIVSEIQPLQNTRIDGLLAEMDVDALKFKQHWIKDGLTNLEEMLASPHTGAFCHGDTPTIADCCLIPQVYNACEMFKMPLEDYPKIKKIYNNAKELPAFQKAWPDKQPDFDQSG